MHAVDGSVVNLCLRCSQRLKNRDSRLFRALRNRSGRNNPPNLRQPPPMSVFVRSMLVWRGHSCPRTLTRIRMQISSMHIFMSLMMGVLVLLMRKLMSVFRFLPLPIFLPRQILLPIHPHIHLSRRNSTAHHPRKFQPSPDSERSHGLFQHARWNPGIHERAEEHVAAHAGKTFKVSNAHRPKVFSPRGNGATEKNKTLKNCFLSCLCVSVVIKFL